MRIIFLKAQNSNFEFFLRITNKSFVQQISAISIELFAIQRKWAQLKIEENQIRAAHMHHLANAQCFQFHDQKFN